MSRVVFDTSTLVGAVLHPSSVPHRAWLLALESCDLLACLQTFREVESVLQRDRLLRYLDTTARDQFLALFQSSVEWITVAQSDIVGVNPPCRDPSDNVFLALASVGRADALVSSDHDLLVLNPWSGIAILTPAQFLAKFEQ